MSAVITLTPLNDSFQTKKLVLSPSVTYKVGRHTNKSTAPASSNLYFNSKVLSRQHAEIWLEKDTLVVYVRDVKSSNGTFVNGNRLSSENKASAPCKLNSGDVLDFGVDIYNEEEIIHKKVSAQIRILTRGVPASMGPGRPLETEVMLDSIMRQMAIQYQRCVELNENLESLEHGVRGMSTTAGFINNSIYLDRKSSLRTSDSIKSGESSSVTRGSLSTSSPDQDLLSPSSFEDPNKSTSTSSPLPLSHKHTTDAAIREAQLAKANLESWKARAFTAEAKLSTKRGFWYNNRAFFLSPFFIAVAGVIVYLGCWR
ncbi:FHA domain-containing protein Far10 [Schizosaccharomyces cryophilus OY26]|uniref:FHA domain-containing protein Far10 n=1 Tax=Schizosaccharomyces cryophilus (strain OY26 / ATCC MYA-4695 / CBS 11777 / NBRC 106824 / NRRL Y48691) TaxID=653667 RepID=S9XGW5_SCHCR|nr:FHA domain-containing protein Far10 [Schizosaccharomyces cryophilus OY26]EPY52906.1 FHA domain-containing protein Far10 [Schizosaccharomyces cryophilus OY26]